VFIFEQKKNGLAYEHRSIHASLEARIDVLGLRIHENRTRVAVGHGNLVEHGPVDSLLGANNHHGKHDRSSNDNCCDDTTRDRACQGTHVHATCSAAIDSVEARGEKADRAVCGATGRCHAGSLAEACRAVVRASGSSIASSGVEVAIAVGWNWTRRTIGG